MRLYFFCFFIFASTIKLYSQTERELSEMDSIDKYLNMKALAQYHEWEMETDSIALITKREGISDSLVQTLDFDYLINNSDTVGCVFVIDYYNTKQKPLYLWVGRWFFELLEGSTESHSGTIAHTNFVYLLPKILEPYEKEGLFLPSSVCRGLKYLTQESIKYLPPKTHFRVHILVDSKHLLQALTSINVYKLLIITYIAYKEPVIGYEDVSHFYYQGEDYFINPTEAMTSLTLKYTISHSPNSGKKEDFAPIQYDLFTGYIKKIELKRDSVTYK